MSRPVLILACLFTLMRTAVPQTAPAMQTPVRAKVPPAISKKLLCGSLQGAKGYGNSSSPPKKINTFCGPVPQPIYPALAKQQGIQGTVILGIVVGADGRVKDVHVFSGHPLLAPAAVDAVKTWTYKPYYLNHKPTEIETTVIVDFSLQKDEIWKEYVYPENGFAITLPRDPHPHESSQMQHGTAYSVTFTGGSGLSLHTTTAHEKCAPILEAQADHAKHMMESGSAESNGFKALSLREVVGTGYKGFEFVQQVPNGKFDYERWVCSGDRLFVFASAWSSGEQQPTEISRIITSFRILVKK